MSSAPYDKSSRQYFYLSDARLAHLIRAMQQALIKPGNDTLRFGRGEPTLGEKLQLLNDEAQTRAALSRQGHRERRELIGAMRSERRAASRKQRGSGDRGDLIILSGIDEDERAAIASELQFSSAPGTALVVISAEGYSTENGWRDWRLGRNAGSPKALEAAAQLSLDQGNCVVWSKDVDADGLTSVRTRFAEESVTLACAIGDVANWAAHPNLKMAVDGVFDCVLETNLYAYDDLAAHLASVAGLSLRSVARQANHQVPLRFWPTSAIRRELDIRNEWPPLTGVGQAHDPEADEEEAIESRFMADLRNELRFREVANLVHPDSFGPPASRRPGPEPETGGGLPGL